MENTTDISAHGAQQSGPVKYCTTCGAQLHIQAEICPKCGVRQMAQPTQASQPNSFAGDGTGSPGASAGTGGMTFSKAVGTCLKKKYATFSGRASLAEYCYFFLFLLLMQLVAFLVLVLFFVGCIIGMSGLSYLEEELVERIGNVIYIVCNLPFVLPYFAVGARRYQDAGYPGWQAAVLLIFFLPIVALGLCVIKGNEGPNRFGPPPDK